MTKAADPEQSGLSFSHATFAKLTPKAYLHAHLKQPNTVRPSGRTQFQFREVSVNSGSLTYSNGSAVVRSGDTAIVCGIRAEILQASDIPLPPHHIPDASLIQELGLLVPNIELSTGCSPAHLPGNPPSTLAQSLTWRLSSLLHSTNMLNIDDLRILYTEPALADDEDDDAAEPRVVTKAYWTLYLDILCISLDGNCFDAAWIALLQALHNTKLPSASWDADRQMILCSPVQDHAKPLQLLNLPVPSTFAAFTTTSPVKDPAMSETWLLADPDMFEEEACAESVTITLQDSSITRIEKSGGQCISGSNLRQCIDLARQRRHDILRTLDLL